MLQIGENVKHYGKVAAVLFTGGERYYMLVSKRGAIALMPADSVEPQEVDMGTYYDNFEDR